MTRNAWRLGTIATIGLLAAAGCSSNDLSQRGSLSPTRLSLSQGTAPIAASVATAIVADLVGEDHGRIELTMVDSLIVHVSQVDVLPESLLIQCFPPRGDSAHGFRPMPPESLPHGMPPRPDGCGPHRGMGPMGPGIGGGFGGGRFGFPPIHPDSLRPDSGWGRRANQWYTLDVVGGGHLDLRNLPADSASALTFASGSLPAGDYGAARLFITDATIWFNTPILADSGGITLKADTGYTVRFPRMADRMGIATGAGFTVPEGGGTVSLIFDANATIAGAGVNDSGQVMILPVLRPRHPR